MYLMRPTLILFSFWFMACGTSTVKLDSGYFPKKTKAMEKVETDDENILAYKLPEFELGNYSKFKIAPVQVVGVSKGGKRLSDEDRLRLTKHLGNAVKNELIQAGYKVVEVNGTDVLGMKFTLSNIDPGDTHFNLFSSGSAIISYGPGRVHIETEFFDTTNNKPLSVVLLGSKGTGNSRSNSDANKWADIEMIFIDWARGFRKTLDKSRKN